MKYLGDYKVKNIEDGTKVLANLYQYSDAIRADYRYKGMSYTVDIPMQELIEIGIVECDHSCVLPILGYENSIIGERCEGCGKEL